MNTSFPKEIRTDRLILKIYDYGYEEELLALLLKNKEHLKGVLSEWVYGINDIEGIKKMIKTAKVGYQLRNFFAFCVWHAPTMKIVGEMILFKTDWKARSLEIGSFVYKEFENQGINSEGKIACFKYCFEQLGIETIYGVCDNNNPKSQYLNLKWFKVYKTTPEALLVKLTKEDFGLINTDLNITFEA